MIDIDPNIEKEISLIQEQKLNSKIKIFLINIVFSRSGKPKYSQKSSNKNLYVIPSKIGYKITIIIYLKLLIFFSNPIEIRYFSNIFFSDR